MPADLNKLEAEFPTLKEIYKRERDAEVQGRREDSATDFLLAVIGIFSGMEVIKSTFSLTHFAS